MSLTSVCLKWCIPVHTATWKQWMWSCSSGHTRVTRRVCAIVLMDVCMNTYTLMCLTKCVNLTVQVWIHCAHVEAMTCLWSAYLSLGTNVYSFFFDWVTPSVSPRSQLCCFELPCRKQSSVLPQTIKQLDFCTCAFVLVWGLVITPSEGPRLSLCIHTHTHAKTHTHTHVHRKSQASWRWMAVLAQKNIWFGYKYHNMKEMPSGVKGKGHENQRRQNLHHHLHHIWHV